jgi:dihydrolipoamide dehydrogenase
MTAAASPVLYRFGRFERGIDVVVATADPAETARGYIHDFHGGALKLVGDRERGVLIGAALVSPRAGEILGELVLAIKLGTPLKTLTDVIHPFQPSTGCWGKP